MKEKRTSTEQQMVLILCEWEQARLAHGAEDAMGERANDLRVARVIRAARASE